MKLLEREIGPSHISADIGCHLFSTLAPFELGTTTAGYGLGTASASSLAAGGRRPIAVMGDGGFWHNGLTSGIGNAVFNQDESVTVVIDNGYSAATGGQENLSSKADVSNRATGKSIERAARAVGIDWARTLQRTYDVGAMRDTLREALTSAAKARSVKYTDRRSRFQARGVSKGTRNSSRMIKGGSTMLATSVAQASDSVVPGSLCSGW